jgi:hypothetical protein
LPFLIEALLQLANQHEHQPLSPRDVEKLETLDSQFFAARVRGGFPAVAVHQPNDGATHLFGDSRLPYYLATPGQIGSQKALQLGFGQPTLNPTAEWIQAMRCLRALTSTEPAAREKVEANGNPKRRRRGRPRDTDPREDQRAAERYQASGIRSIDQYATKEGLDTRKVRCAIERHRKRLARKRNK